MSRRQQDHRPTFRSIAVVGGSIAGLLAAAAASPHADRVLVFERDRLPHSWEPRPGTPQASHSHGLLASGREAIESLLPGFTGELIAAGAISRGDIGQVARWWIGGGLLAECTLGLRGVAASRGLIEQVIRERIRRLPNVELCDGADVAGLRGANGRVSGLVVRERAGASGPGGVAGAAAERVVATDLVVDASGRSGRASRWLPEIGAVAPVEERIQIGLRYVTTHLSASDDDLGGATVVVCAAVPPIPRGGVAIRQEDQTWTLTLFGYGDQPIPIDPDGLRQFAAGLVAPDLAALLVDREPLHPVLTYRFPDCRRRRFPADRLPPGYVPIGDAICSVDPAFGQGMSIAALQAVALGDALESGLDGVGEYARRAEQIVDRAWTVVAGSVRALPGIATGAGPSRTQVLLGRYLRRLQLVARRDPRVAAAFLRVTNLMAPAASLLSPPVAARVLMPRTRSSAMSKAADRVHATRF